MFVTMLPQKELISLPEVSSTKPYNKNKLFSADGLYSEQIFGPVNDYQCQDKMFIGKIHEGKICPKCGVKVTSSLERFKNFGKITLPLRIIHPYAFPFLTREFGQSVVKAISNGEKFYKVVNKKLELVEEEDVDGGTGGEFLFHVISKLGFKDKKTKDFIMLYKNEVFPQYLPVIPVGARNMLKVDNVVVVDDINNVYVRILKKNQAMARVVVMDKSLLSEYYEIQSFVEELFQKLEEKIGKKKGLIRQNLLGKRADFSSRAVIVPSPHLPLDKVELPLAMCKELYKFHILSHLINKVKVSALSALERLDTMTDDEYLDILNEITATSCVILNRQPTLHRMGMIAFYPIVKKDTNAIAIPVLACPPFNADFDGDQIAVYLPLSEAALDEARGSLLATNQIISPSNRDITFLPSHDIVLGLYKLTKFGPKPRSRAVSISDTISKEELLSIKMESTVTYKGRRTTAGRVLFNKVIRELVDFVDIPVTKNVLYSIMKDERLRPHLSVLIDEIKNMGFYLTTRIGSSFAVSDFILKGTAQKKSAIKDVRDMKEIENLEALMIEELKDNDVFDMIKSGARGSFEQVRQISLFKGLVTDVVGQIQSEPIKHGLLEGLTPKEFFRSSYGSRKGVVDSSLNTGQSGHLTRKLVFALSPCIVDYSNSDCKSTRYFDIEVTTPILPFLKDRYILVGNKEVKISNSAPYLGKTIKLRSPIHCKGEHGFCSKCVGHFPWGKEIGIMAAQAMGERATQMTLRTFHTGGIAKSALGGILDKLNHPALDLEGATIVARKDGFLTLLSDEDDDEGGESVDGMYQIKIGNDTILIESVPEIDIFHVGKFISGTALLQVNFRNDDIVSDLRQLRLVLDNKNVCKQFIGPNLGALLTELIEVFTNYGMIDIVFLETLLSQLARADGVHLRFSDKQFPDDMKTLSSLPLSSSIIQGMSFERFRSAVTKSLDMVKDGTISPNKTVSVLERLLLLKF